MKVTILPLLAALLAASYPLNAEPQSPPPETSGEVRLPYVDFQRLLDATNNQPPPAKPPLAASFLSARYEFDASSPTPEILATFVAENFTDEWLLLPVAPASLHILFEEDAPLVRHGAHFALVLHEKGRTTARVRFIPASGQDTIARFPISPATSNLLVIHHDEANPAFSVSGGLPGQSHANSIHHHLSADASEVVIRMESPEPSQPGAWSVSSELFVHHEDGWLNHHLRLRATALSGDSRRLDLQLPDHTSHLLIDGPKQTSRSATNQVQLQWDDRETTEREIFLSYRIATPPMAGEWAPETPEIINGESRHLLVLARPPGADIRADNLTAVSDPSHLPQWIQEKLDGRPAAMIRESARPVLKIEWLPRMATETTVVSEASLQTRVVANGATLTTASYTIEHQAASLWLVNLPGEPKLLDATLNGRRIQPIQRDDYLEFELPSASNDSSTTTITFSYTGKTTPLDPVNGGFHLTSPQTPLFIHQIDWQVLLPDDYTVDGIESNAEIPLQNTSSHYPKGIHLRQRLSQNEPIQTEIFYRNRILND